MAHFGRCIMKTNNKIPTLNALKATLLATVVGCAVLASPVTWSEAVANSKDECRTLNIIDPSAVVKPYCMVCMTMRWCSEAIGGCSFRYDENLKKALCHVQPSNIFSTQEPMLRMCAAFGGEFSVGYENNEFEGYRCSLQ